MGKWFNVRSKVVAHTVIYIIIMAFVASLTGCASTGALQMKTPVTMKLRNYKTLIVAVSSKVTDTSLEAVQIESMIVNELRNKGDFEKVVRSMGSPDWMFDLKLNVVITAMHKVSVQDRLLLWGAFTGQASTVLEIDLIDMRKGVSIGSATIEGKSSTFTSFAEATEQSIKRAVEEVVSFIENNL